jgi:hypothetical protein
MMRALAVSIVLMALLWPEVGRYRAERELRRLTTAFRALLSAPPGADRNRALAAIDAEAEGLIPYTAPGDSRLLMLAGSARLVAKDSPGALGRYRAALARGERAEIDLALARAHIVLHEMDDGQAALVRAAWVSPALAHTLPRDARRSLLREVKLRARALRAGSLSSPPTLPAVDRPAR